eukprot:TRINITY_DN643_c0_g1_i1.p1 TRINITY_DN643_c0_g1~~TRINITY_DN643_c0_g1_i1.p1  ORF type:complete len:146 (-),score=30.87 TRINITY_DN643_c0_g1_i1:134-571(-)
MADSFLVFKEEKLEGGLSIADLNAKAALVGTKLAQYRFTLTGNPRESLQFEEVSESTEQPESLSAFIASMPLEESQFILFDYQSATKGSTRVLVTWKGLAASGKDKMLFNEAERWLQPKLEGEITAINPVSYKNLAQRFELIDKA